MRLERSDATPDSVTLITRGEALWILRRRAGLTIHDGPCSHVTQVKWEAGRGWGVHAQQMLNELLQDNGYATV